MNVQMHGKDMVITDGLREAIKSATQKLSTFNLNDVKFTLEVTKSGEQIAKVTTSVPKHGQLHASHSDADMYVSIGHVVETLRTQLEKIRDKSKNVNREVIVDQIESDEE